MADDQLDPLSSAFDPVEALKSSEEAVKLPYPDARPLDNLAKYESLVKGTLKDTSGPRGSRNTGEPAVDEVQAVKKECEDSPTATSTKTKVSGSGAIVRTVIDFMINPHLRPFLMLKECVANESSVNVWIRNIAGIRGVMQGQIVLFDKHFNLLIRNVWQVYIPFNAQIRKKQKKRRQRRHRKRANRDAEEKGETCSIVETPPYEDLFDEPPCDKQPITSQDDRVEASLSFPTDSEAESTGVSTLFTHSGEATLVSLRQPQQDMDCSAEARSLFQMLLKYSFIKEVTPRVRFSKYSFLRGDSVIVICKVEEVVATGSQTSS